MTDPDTMGHTLTNIPHLTQVSGKVSNHYRPPSLLEPSQMVSKILNPLVLSSFITLQRASRFRSNNVLLQTTYIPEEYPSESLT